MRALLLAATACVALAGAASAQQEQRFDARLAGHAVLPAMTMALPPADAPRDAMLSGKFAGASTDRNESAGSFAATTGPAPEGRLTGLNLPFVGQPVQGFSGIKPVTGEAGAYWVLTDNGFGNKRNSGDALLAFRKIRPDFKTGQIAVLDTVWLTDPDRRVPFRIANEATEARYLTGSDFDPESIQPATDGSGFGIGEEFGPFIIKVDMRGRVQRVVPTMLDGKPLMGPDNPALSVGATPTARVNFRARRSGGYEGMAMLPDGSRLWALLEQPLLAEGGDQPEGAFIRMIEFDTQKNDWTGRSLKFRLAEGAAAIGDFNMIDDRRALVIERDNGEGDPSAACGNGQRPPACFHAPARVKRISLIDLGAPDAEGFVRKIGFVDLMNIQDPEKLARQRGDLGANAPADRLSFPFLTIENVARVDEEHIIVGNDNNLPFSAGRHLTRADDNEMVLLHVPALLQAR